MDNKEIYNEKFFPHEIKFVEKNIKEVKSYFQKAILGKEKCEKSKVAVVSLARDCQKNLQKSIDLVKKIQCEELKCFFYENDSVDKTKEILTNNKSSQIEISLNTHNLEYLKDASKARTSALSKYRNICVEWVKKNCVGFDYVIVLDVDPDLGFSVNGIYNSIYWLNNLQDAAGMGSYSLFVTWDRKLRHYDTFAIRLNKWHPSTQHRQEEQFFQTFHPKLGRNPIPFYSCFGGLAVYKFETFIQGKYDSRYGCEHVAFHKTIKDKGYRMYLNPSSRFFAVQR